MKLLLIGCGNLGRSLLQIFEKRKEEYEIVVVQPSLSARDLFPFAHFVDHVSRIPQGFNPEVAILAFKPQQMKDGLPRYASSLKSALVISFAAGMLVKTLDSYLGGHPRLLRVMPNVALKIGKSVNLTYGPKNFSEADRLLAEKVLNPTGALIWIEKEELIEALTPISACGPAYFFLLAEIMTQFTMELGLEEKLARSLVQETFLGSALLTVPTHDFKKMISSVASKGGVTEAALTVLQPKLSDLMRTAVNAALEKLKKIEQ